jgi:hypothetical protein
MPHGQQQQPTHGQQRYPQQQHHQPQQHSQQQPVTPQSHQSAHPRITLPPLTGSFDPLSASYNPYQ